jgi:hypothetical protein
LRKSVLTGGLSNSGGGSGKAGHWRCSASAGTGRGAWGFAAQALSKRTSGGKTRLKIILGPFRNGALSGFDALGGGAVGGAGGLGRGAVVGDGFGHGRSLAGIKLLELGGLLLPVAGLGFLDDQQDGERERGDEPGEALRVEKAKEHH